MRKVHRLVTDAEKAVCRQAHTFNRATGRYHNLAGFEIRNCPCEGMTVRRRSQRRAVAL